MRKTVPVRLADVRLVLTTPKLAIVRQAPARRAATQAYNEARVAFQIRATPPAWARLVASSRRLHEIKKAEPVGIPQTAIAWQ